MYEKNRMLFNSNLAGFSHWEGALVADQLEVGTKIEMVCEFDNPYDPDAIALYFNDTKLGYIPRALNSVLAQLLYFGHDIFECVVIKKDLSETPEHQFDIAVYIADNREETSVDKQYDFELSVDELEKLITALKNF